MERTTIEDVARRAGVSISTVSYALSNKRPISEQTRRKIQQAIDELGFRPNPSAKRLASREKTRNIGFVLPLKGAEMTGLEMNFIRGAVRVINQADYTLLLLAHPEPESENLLRFARNGAVDGFIIMETQIQDERVKLLKREGLPFALIGRCEDTTGLCYVDTDVDAGMEMCFRHLESLDRGPVALLARAEARLGFAVRSVAAYRAACARRGLPQMILPCAMTVDDGEAAMSRLFDGDSPISAALVWNEIPAAGVARAARVRGRRIPGDFTIICLSESLAPNTAPDAPLVVDLRAEEMAARAAQMLIDLLEGRPTETQVLIPPRFA